MAQTPVEVKKAASAPAPVHDPWQSFRDEMDRLFDRFTTGFRLPSRRRRMFDLEPMRGFESSFSFAAPAIDVAEDEKAYTITAELPGLELKDIEISVSGDTLTLKGEKQQQKEEKNKNYYMSERSYGSFRRSFLLPESVDGDKIAANLGKGVLTLTLPKTAETQKAQRKIEIKGA